MTDHLAQHRETAQRIRGDYNAKLAVLRANKDLSVDGRRRAVTDLFQQTKSALAEQGVAERAYLTARRDSLERDLFGGVGRYGDDALSARDAADRAASSRTASDAANLLQRAVANGDDVLARAVARHAHESGNTGDARRDAPWEDVLRTFLSHRPALQPVVDELAQIETLEAPNLFNPFSLPTPSDVREFHATTANASAGSM